MIKPHALIARIVWIITLIAFGGTSFAQTYTATPLPSSGLVNQYPYNFTGLITTISSSGSGAVVRNPRVVYSCAHVVFSTQYLSIGIDPWLSEVRWHRAWFNGSPPAENAGQSLRGYIYYVAYSDAAAAKQNSLAAFDLDFVVHYAYENTAAGGYAGSWSDGASILKGGGSKLITGYPSALYQSGDPREYLMHSTGPFTRAFYALYDDYLGVNEVSTAPGNSGGPVWVSDGADYYFAGVLVSGSTRSLGKPTDFTGVYGVDSSSLALIDAAMTAGGGAVAAPVITSQPVSRRVNVGQSVSLSVTATGQGLGYRWLKNGVTIAGAAAASYTVASASLADAGSYQVIVSNSGGETRSAVVTLAVDSAPVISVPPASITIIEGQVAQLTVAATGSGSLKYQWYQGQSGSTISPVSGATSATFTTNPLSATTAFWVRITDGSGTFTDSSSATVTVTPSPPKIVANPSDLMVRNGQSAVFSVTATGLGPLSYRWYWDGFLIGGEERASLTIDPVRDSNRGRYSVTITNAGGTITSSAAELVIGAPPLITVQPLLSSPQPAGSSVSLSVIAAGSPAPSYQWRKAGVPIANATKSSYSIQTLGPLDAGTYDVVLDNVWGSARSHAVKLVVSQAPVITGQPESQVASIGSTAYLKVIAAGVPQVLFQWRKDGVDLAGSTNATLAIQNVQASSAGKYSVTVSNDSGSVSSAWITLKVTGVGVPSVQPSSLRYVFPEGGGGVLNATVSGATDLQWKRNGRPISGATNSQLTISGAKPIRDNGWYQLSASNEDGIIDSQPVFVLVSGGYRVQAWGDPSVTNVPASLDDVVAISAGAYHSLAIRSDGSVASWGSSGSEVSGVVPTGLGPVVGVAAGWGHSLALRHDGTVVAWGKSEVGMAPPDLDRVVSVAAGDSHALALKADGTVVAWGYNSRGQTNVPTGLSDVETIAAGEYFSLASKRDGTVVMWPAFGTGSNLAMPSSLAGVTLISSGYRHILALKSGGTCQGWGSLGGNNFNSQYVSGLAGLVSLSAGDIHGVFLYADGRVYATGYGIGQSLAEVPNQLGGVAAVSAGYRHTIALSAHRKPSIAQNPLAVSAPAGASAAFSVLATAGGAPLAYQWRRNSTPISGATQSTYSIGQINDLSAGVYDVLVSNYLGSSTSSSALLSIIPAVSATITVNPVSTTATAGQPVILSVAASGTPTPAFQWTKNGTAIPNATKASLEIPFANPEDSGSYAVIVQNSIGGSLVSLTSSSAVLSVITTPPKITSSPTNTSTPVGADVHLSVDATGSALSYQWYRDGMAISGATQATLALTNVQKWDQGAYHAVVQNPSTRVASADVRYDHVAFVKQDGTLWVVGNNDYGQLGDGGTVRRTTPFKVAADVLSVSTGRYHTMFITRDGALWGMGKGAMLGINTTVDQKTPVKVATGVASVVAGEEHTMFIRINGTLEAMGSNDSGKFGNGGNGGFYLTPVTIASNVEAVSSARYHTVFIKKDRTLWGAGSNINGELGDSSTVNRGMAVKIADSVRDARAGFIHTMFIKEDASVWAMGHNRTGQLGDGTTLDRITPVKVAQGAAAVSPGFKSSLLLQSDGKLLAAGANQWGELGYAVRVERSTWVNIEDKVVYVAAGNNNTLWIKADGSLWGSGYNYSGQLGDGTTVDRSSPVLIAGGGVLSATALLAVTEPAAPKIEEQPLPQIVGAPGQDVTFSVRASGNPSPSYQWFFNGVALEGATRETYTISSAQSGSVGNYSVTIYNSAGSVSSSVATLEISQPGNSATHAAAGGSYVAGQQLTLTNSLAFSGTASSLSWKALLPDGWTFVSAAGTSGISGHSVGEGGLLEWTWSSVPPSPVTFTYTVNVPAGQSGAKEVVALVGVGGSTGLQFIAKPDPLILTAISAHVADSDRNLKISLTELTRVIELYNTRSGTTRTGFYRIATITTEDGYDPAPERSPLTNVSLARYHSADSNRDGRISLTELTRVIELYNYRSGTTRTGQYKPQAGTEDGFAAGPP